MSTQVFILTEKIVSSPKKFGKTNGNFFYTFHFYVISRVENNYQTT